MSLLRAVCALAIALYIASSAEALKCGRKTSSDVDTAFPTGLPDSLKPVPGSPNIHDKPLAVGTDSSETDDDDVPPGGSGSSESQGINGNGPALPDSEPETPETVEGQAIDESKGSENTDIVGSGLGIPSTEVQKIIIPDAGVTFDIEQKGFPPLYDDNPAERFASVNAGTVALLVGAGGLNAAFKSQLGAAGQKTDDYEKLHTNLFKVAQTKNENITSDAKVEYVIDDVSSSGSSKDLKFALCRPSVEAQKEGWKQGQQPWTSTGIVFIDIFNEDKRPKKKEKNMAMVYAVGPHGNQQGYTKGTFLRSVEKTGANIMAALCDYNEFAKSSENNSNLESIEVCGMTLISGQIYIHPGATKVDVAQALIKGLNSKYRHGLAPNLKFAYDDDVFKTAWKALKPETNAK